MQGSIRQHRSHATRPRHARGQALVLGLVLLLVLCVGAVLLFNTGQIVHKKVQLTNTADAAAYSVAVQQARAWNFAAYMNRGRIANEVAVAQFISIYSWLNQLNTSSYVLKQFFNVLSKIPFPPVSIPAAILYVAFNAADQALLQIRRVFRPVVASAVQLLGKFNQIYAKAAEIVVRFSSKVEALYIADVVVSKNMPNADISAASLLYLANQLRLAESQFLDFHKLPARNRQSEAFNRYRNVVMQSRDRFSWNRTDFIGLGPIKFGAYGGTDMVAYDRWAALDTMQLKIELPWWIGDDIDIPVGWGGAQAVENYQGQKFLPGFNRGRGWRSPFDRRRYGIYGGMNGRDVVTRAAANDPNVGVHNGRDKDAYFTGYTGLQNYHDIKRGKITGSEDGPVFTVEVEAPITAARTSSTVGIGAGRMELRESTDRLAALASAQVYFNRPPDYALFQRADGNLETGSMFSPYWQARLIDTPAPALAALGLAGAAGL